MIMPRHDSAASSSVGVVGGILLNLIAETSLRLFYRAPSRILRKKDLSTQRRKGAKAQRAFSVLASLRRLRLCVKNPDTIRGRDLARMSWSDRLQRKALKDKHLRCFSLHCKSVESRNSRKIFAAKERKERRDKNLCGFSLRSLRSFAAISFWLRLGRAGLFVSFWRPIPPYFGLGPANQALTPIRASSREFSIFRQIPLAHPREPCRFGDVKRAFRPPIL